MTTIEVVPGSQLSKLIASTVAVPATTGREAVAALNAKTAEYNQRLAADATMCGDAINSGHAFPPPLNDSPGLVGLGVRVTATEVVIICAQCECDHECRRRIGRAELPPPTTKEEFRQWQKNLDYDLAEIHRNRRVKNYYVSFSPNITDKPLVAGQELTEDELIAALEGKAPFGYAWCHLPSYTEGESEDAPRRRRHRRRRQPPAETN